MLSPRSAAQRLGTTLVWIYHELWAGRLPGARKVGSTWRIPTEVIEARLKAKNEHATRRVTRREHGR
ncbi:MAG: helix-turn-helix domain-containing protein [Terriglobales bacterium]